MADMEGEKTASAETKAAQLESASPEAAGCKATKGDAEPALAKVHPALEEAEKVLSELKASDISEVAKFLHPPMLVKLVVEALCVMLQVEPYKVTVAGMMADDYWGPGKKLLGDKDLLRKMKDFDKDNIPETVIKRIDVYVQHEDFKPEKVNRVSKACTAMCRWTIAMHMYYHATRGQREALAKA